VAVGLYRERDSYTRCSKGIWQLKVMKGSNAFLRPHQSKSELLQDMNRGRITNLDRGNESYQLQLCEAELDKCSTSFGR
jgi:hypothetical protein